MIVNDLNEIISASNSISEETYNNMLPYIEENYNKAKPFLTIEERLKEKMIKLIDG